MPMPLGRDEIHIWTAVLDGRETPLTVLDSLERERAGRFGRPRLRADFVRTRTVLRRVLAGYLDCDPGSLAFSLGPHGKPALEGTDLQFNASHSGICLVIAARWWEPVGIDVEGRRDVGNIAAIARRFFTPPEASQLDALPAARQAEAFRSLWTLKEAVVKAAGEALAYNMDRVEGALNADGSARFVAWHGGDEAAQDWSIFPFSPAPDFAATLATKPPARTPRLLIWNAEDR